MLRGKYLKVNGTFHLSLYNCVQNLLLWHSFSFEKENNLVVIDTETPGI